MMRLMMIITMRIMMRLEDVYDGDDDNDDQGLGSCCVLTTDECSGEISRNRTYIQRHHIFSLIIFYIWSSLTLDHI